MSEDFKPGNSTGFDDGSGNFGLHCEMGDLSPKGVEFAVPETPPFLLAKLYTKCGCVAVPADKAPDSCPTHTASTGEVIQPSTGDPSAPVREARVQAVNELMEETKANG